MNVSELTEKLNRKGVPDSYYSINDSIKPDIYVLNCTHGKWEYYYDEKGNQENYRRFDIESEACEFLFEKLMREMLLLNSIT